MILESNRPLQKGVHVEGWSQHATHSADPYYATVVHFDGKAKRCVITFAEVNRNNDDALGDLIAARIDEAVAAIRDERKTVNA